MASKDAEAQLKIVNDTLVDALQLLRIVQKSLTDLHYSATPEEQHVPRRSLSAVDTAMVAVREAIWKLNGWEEE